MIERVRGDILTAKVEALVNPVNTVGVAGAGLAEQFRRAYPAAYRSYRSACQRGAVTIGEMFCCRLAGAGAPRWIINFPTKVHWRDPSEISFIDEGLRALVRDVRALQIASVAIPALGCGLGGLSPDLVLPAIERACLWLPDDVRVLIYVGL